MAWQKSRHAGTPALDELRAKQQPGKCIICYAPLQQQQGRGQRRQTCPGECHSAFLYAHNKAVMARIDDDRRRARSKQSNETRDTKNRLANTTDWWPPVPGLPCSTDPWRAMDKDREAIADAQLRAFKLNRERKAA